MNAIKQIQERNLKALARNPGGFQFTDTFFPYTSGEIGPYYVQSAAVLANGNDYAMACRDLKGMLAYDDAGGFDVISGGESRDWMFSFPLAREWAKPHLMIYKDGKTLGADVSGKTVLHVADLNNEGSSPKDVWIPVIKKAGGEIKHIAFYVDRLEGGVQVMEDLGLQRHVAVPLDEHAWDFLDGFGIVSGRAYRNLRERGTEKEQRDAWARKMLRSDPGLKTLTKLILSDKKGADKGIKILNKGYPDMRQELVDEMVKRKLLLPSFGEVLIEGED